MVNCEGKVVQKGQSVFKDTNIKIITESQQHLGAVIGLETFKQKYVQEKIYQWIKDLHVLCKIAWCEPQAAYSGFIKGFNHKTMFLLYRLAFHKVVKTNRYNRNRMRFTTLCNKRCFHYNEYS